MNDSQILRLKALECASRVAAPGHGAGTAQFPSSAREVIEMAETFKEWIRAGDPPCTEPADLPDFSKPAHVVVPL